jgi:hypothetical protein
VLAERGLRSLAAIQLPPNIKKLNVEKNQIRDFVGFIPSANLEMLNVACNPIESFKGMPQLPALVSIDMTGTPYALGQFYRVSLLLLFPKSLRAIDTVRISATERKMASEYPQGSDGLVRAGWIITYPPPKPSEFRNILSALAKGGAQNRQQPPARVQPALLPTKTKAQSKFMDEMLRRQEAELAKLQQDIQKVQARRTRRTPE